MLGLSENVRNGFETINVKFKVRGNATEEQLGQIIEQAKARSLVLDVITNGTPVRVDVDAAAVSRSKARD